MTIENFQISEERLVEVIRAARERLENRQRELDAAKGRSADDERTSRDKDGKPRRGPRYKRESGVPENKFRTVPALALADAGFRAEGVFDELANHPSKSSRR